MMFPSTRTTISKWSGVVTGDESIEFYPPPPPNAVTLKLGVDECVMVKFLPLDPGSGEVLLWFRPP